MVIKFSNIWRDPKTLPYKEGEYLIIYRSPRVDKPILKRAVLRRTKSADPKHLLDIIDGQFRFDMPPILAWTDCEELPQEIEDVPT